MSYTLTHIYMTDNNTPSIHIPIFSDGEKRFFRQEADDEFNVVSYEPFEEFDKERLRELSLSDQHIHAPRLGDEALIALELEKGNVRVSPVSKSFFENDVDNSSKFINSFPFFSLEIGRLLKNDDIVKISALSCAKKLKVHGDYFFRFWIKQAALSNSVLGYIFNSIDEDLQTFQQEQINELNVIRIKAPTGVFKAIDEISGNKNGRSIFLRALIDSIMKKFPDPRKIFEYHKNNYDDILLDIRKRYLFNLGYEFYVEALVKDDNIIRDDPEVIYDSKNKAYRVVDDFIIRRGSSRIDTVHLAYLNKCLSFFRQGSREEDIAIMLIHFIELERDDLYDIFRSFIPDTAQSQNIDLIESWGPAYETVKM